MLGALPSTALSCALHVSDEGTNYSGMTAKALIVCHFYFKSET